MTSITVVTPWRNHREFARDYWLAVWPQDCEVIVVDNGSDPPLPNAVRMGYNAGFCKANNVGLELATTDAVLFLNNDVAATSEWWLEPIRDALEPGVLVGAKLRFDGHGSASGQPMPYLDGWCLAGMRDDLIDLGGWDESLHEPAYYSDNMLCLEARASGMSLREVRVGLRHKTNGSTDPSDVVVQQATAANRSMFLDRANQYLEPIAA